MTAILDEFKLAYFAVPKVACTSIKTMFFELENGFPFRDFRTNGRAWWIHHFYRSIPFDEQNHDRVADYRRIAVVRHPLQRLLSCYSNRVLHHRELSRDKALRPLRRAGLPYDPDLPTFVANLRGYMNAVETINHHAAPITDYLGKNHDYYARVYGMSDLDAFTADIQAIVGRSVVLPRLQTGGPKIGVEALSDAERKTLTDFYAADFEVYGAHF